MKKEDAQTAMGLALPVIVFVVFLILKLTGIIAWTWWWVTSPLWIAGGLISTIMLMYIIVFTIRYHKYNR